MALSPAVELWWGRTRVNYVTSAADIPTFDAGSTFQVGDLLININPVTNVPLMWQCTTSGQSPVFQAVVTNTNPTPRTAAAPTTITPTDYNLVITAAGTVTIPAAASLTAGSPVNVIDASTGAVTITPVSGTISGLASVTLAAGGAVSIANLGGTLYTV